MKLASKVMLSLALVVTPLIGAEDVRKVIELKHAVATSLQRHLSGVNYFPDDTLKLIRIWGPADRVAEAEETIKKLDVAPRNIEVLAYLVFASAEPQTAAEPAELSPAIKQMRSLFAYKSYRLLDTIWVRTLEEHRLDSAGMAPRDLKSSSFEPTYTLFANGVSVVSTDPMTIHFDNLSFTLRVRENVSVHITSSVDIREGQKVVIGKTNPTGADSAVILVLTAKVIE